MNIKRSRSYMTDIRLYILLVLALLAALLAHKMTKPELIEDDSLDLDRIPDLPDPDFDPYFEEVIAENREVLKRFGGDAVFLNLYGVPVKGARFHSEPKDYISPVHSYRNEHQIQVHPISRNVFDFSGHRDLPTIRPSLAMQAAINSFRADEFFHDQVTPWLKQYVWYPNGHKVRVLTFPTEHTLHVEENTHFYDGNNRAMTQKVTYFRGGHGVTALATPQMVIRPQAGCVVERSLPIRNVVAPVIFSIVQDCLSTIDENNEHHFASEFNQGLFQSFTRQSSGQPELLLLNSEPSFSGMPESGFDPYNEKLLVLKRARPFLGEYSGLTEIRLPEFKTQVTRLISKPGYYIGHGFHSEEIYVYPQGENFRITAIKNSFRRYQSLAMQAASNHFRADTFYHDHLNPYLKQYSWYYNGNSISILTFPTEHTVHAEERIRFYDGKDEIMTHQVTYFRGGHGVTTLATLQSVVKPEANCVLARSFPIRGVLDGLIFRIIQDCLSVIDETNAHHFASEFNQGRFYPVPGRSPVRPAFVLTKPKLDLKIKPDSGFNPENEKYLLLTREFCRTGVSVETECSIYLQTFVRFKAVLYDSISFTGQLPIYVSPKSLDDIYITIAPFPKIYPIEVQAALNTFSTGVFNFQQTGVYLTERFMHHGSGQGFIRLAFPTEDTVQEEITLFSDGQKKKTTYPKITYFRRGHGVTMLATNKDVIRPQEGCAIEETLPIHSVLPFSIFRIRQNCNLETDGHLANEFRRGAFHS